MAKRKVVTPDSDVEDASQLSRDATPPSKRPRAAHNSDSDERDDYQRHDSSSKKTKARRRDEESEESNDDENGDEKNEEDARFEAAHEEKLREYLKKKQRLQGVSYPCSRVFSSFLTRMHSRASRSTE